MANIKTAYSASSNLTVTNLHSIATSSTWVSGWVSPIIDNTSDLDLTKIVTGKIALGNAATAGQIRVYAFAMLDDSNWPAVLSAGTMGTEGTATMTTTTIRDACGKLCAAIETRADPGTDDVYNFAFNLATPFDGILVAKAVLFISHSTGANLASSGNQITIKGVYATST